MKISPGFVMTRTLSLPGVPAVNGTRPPAANPPGAAPMFCGPCATPGTILFPVTDHLPVPVTWIGVLMNLMNSSLRR